MLDKNVQSQNDITITGVLKELEIVEGKTGDGRDYVRGIAFIAVDQEVDLSGNGQVEMVENVIPVKMFSMKLKKDGSANKLYDRILSYKKDFISAAAAEDPSEASRVSVTGNISENAFYNDKTDKVISTFQISSNFINKAKDNDVEGAKFTFSGVVLNNAAEVNTDGEETGRAIIKLGLVGYNSTLHVINLIAAGSKKEFIDNNWQVKDTVKVTGIVNMSHEVKTITEEQGFGEPIVRTKTINKNELIITGGSASGLDEDYSYDADDISTLLDDRKAAQEALKTPKKTAKATSGGNGFGF